MITVRDAVKVLTLAKSITLGYNDSAIPIDKDDEFLMSAFGDYVVESIRSVGDNLYELAIAMRPVKAGEVK